MPRLIVFRIHPIEPVNGADFTSYLEDLSITLSDLARTRSDQCCIRKLLTSRGHRNANLICSSAMIRRMLSSRKTAISKR
jgi:hypothetical protein